MANNDEHGTIKEGEYHPSANSAFRYVKAKILAEPMLIEAIASTALSGNRTAEICYSTIDRIMHGQPVSDRYVLGLAWFFLEMDNPELLAPNTLTEKENTL